MRLGGRCWKLLGFLKAAGCCLMPSDVPVVELQLEGAPVCLLETRPASRLIKWAAPTTAGMNAEVF